MRQGGQGRTGPLLVAPWLRYPGYQPQILLRHSAASVCSSLPTSLNSQGIDGRAKIRFLPLRFKAFSLCSKVSTWRESGRSLKISLICCLEQSCCCHAVSGTHTERERKRESFTTSIQPAWLMRTGLCSCLGLLQQGQEREVHYVHSASLAHEDGIVFMSEPSVARQWQTDFCAT